MEVATARHAVNAAALSRDRLALVEAAASLPATIAFSYERHRARAYANALEGSGAAALAELNLAAVSLPPSAAVLAADAAALHLLLGDPARSIATLSVAARSDRQFDGFSRGVLLAATREAPAEWRRAARAAVLVRHPRAAMVAASAAFDSLGDRRPYRFALATTGLLTALVALLALPALLLDGGAPGGVTAPSFAAPPSVVVVPERALRPLQLPGAAEPALSVLPPSAELVRATPQAPRLFPQGRHPARPRFGRPAPVSPAPAPAPVPAPAPEPPPVVVLAAASPVVATSAPPAADLKPKTSRGKAKGHANKPAKAVAAPVIAAPEAAPQAPAPAPETEPAGTSEPPGQTKHDDKEDKEDKEDKKDKQK